MKIKFFRWYGGKIRLVETLKLLIPEHVEYVEPFAGSAALLLNHSRSREEVINDKDADVAFLLQTMADHEKGSKLEERLCSLQYDRFVFEAAVEARRRQYSGMNDIEKATMIFITITQSFNCTRKTFSEKAFAGTRAYQRDIRFHIPNVYRRLQGVRVQNRDGIELLQEISDNPDAFAFVDPPYRWELRGAGADRAYACEMPQWEHVRLLETVQDAKCKVMLCGYRSETGADLYDIYLKPYGWKCYKVGEYAKSCQVKKKHRDMGHEFIWVNYEVPFVAKYISCMKEY